MNDLLQVEEAARRTAAAEEAAEAAEAARAAVTQELQLVRRIRSS